MLYAAPVILTALALAACGSPKALVADAPAGESDAAADADPPGVDALVDSPAAMVDAPDAGPLGDPIAELVALPKVCSSAGWCWERPLPSGTSYGRIAATGPANIWISGGGPPGYAAIMQWNGHTWTDHKPPLGTCPVGVHCEYAFPMDIDTAGPDNTWLVYTNLTEHWDGTAWTIVDVELTNVTVAGVWIAPDGDAWVSRNNGTVKRWHNGVATIYNAGIGVGSIWGTDSTDIFATSIGAIAHFDGTQWSVIYNGGKTAGAYQGIRNDVWISGGDGAILHWNGTTMTEVPVAVPAHASVGSANYTDTSDVSFISTGASAGAEYFIHWNGTAMEVTPIVQGLTPLGDNQCGELGMAKVIDGRYWIVCGGGAIAMRSGPDTMKLAIEPFVGAGNLWGTSTTDLYQALGSSLRHWDGTTWTTQPVRIVEIAGLAGTGVGGTNELFGLDTRYVAGAYMYFFVHFDGAAWSAPILISQGTGNGLTTVRPLGHDEAIILGQRGAAFHYQNGAVTQITTGTTNMLISAWGPDADHLMIVGDHGTFLLWDRANPNIATQDPSFPVTVEDLHTIGGAGGEIWISAWGESHVWRKPVTGGWQLVPSRVAPYGMVVLSPTNVVVAATDSGIISRWNGTTFEIELYPSWRGFSSLYALPGGTTYLTGNAGMIVHP